MRAERRWIAALAALILGSAGCASTSIRPDIARVAALSRATLPDAVASSKVDPDTPGDARAILARPLTIDAAVRVAILNNRSLRASIRELGVARGLLVQAGIPPNPTVELGLRRRTDGARSIEGEVAVEYDLTRALLTPLRAGAARADLDAARYRAAAAVILTGYEVRAAFLAFQAASQRLAVAERILDAFAAGRDAAKALLDAGNVPALDFETQDAAYESARATAAQIALEVLDRREEVHRLLGLRGEDTKWTAQGSLPPAPDRLDMPADLERRAVEASLDLAEMRSRIDAAGRRVDLTRAEGRAPDVALIARGEQDGPGYRIGGGARVTLPIFDRKQGAVAAREADLDAQVDRYHGAEIDVRSAAREAMNRATSAHARARLFQETIVPARRRVLDQAILQYNAMQVGVFQLLEAERARLDAELSAIDALRDLWTARAAVDAILAGRRVGLSMTAPPAGLDIPSQSSGGH